MTKVRNIILICLAAVVVCAALVTRLLASAGVSFPEVTGIGQGWRALEGRAVADEPQLSLDSFASGDFQSAVDSYASDSLPFHDQAMLLNAQLQEVGISQAAGLFGFDVYPTYFGSSRLYIASQDAVTYQPFTHTEYHDQKLAEYAQGIAKEAAAYPEKRFVVYVVQGFSEPAQDPAYSLVSNPFLPQEGVDALKSVLADCPNVTVLTDSYDSLDGYYEDFFRSDHHWNIKGALRAYNTIADELGLQAVDTGSLTLRQVCEGYNFMGATSRWGRRVVYDEALDADVDYSGVTYTDEDGVAHDGNDHSGFSDLEAGEKVYSFYDKYYDDIPEGLIQGTGTGSALLISNSYGGALIRQLATQFETLFRSKAMRAGHEETFSELLEESDADTVIFVANASDYMTAAAELPDFFD